MKEPRDNQTSSASHLDDVCERVEIRVHELMDLRQSLLSDEVVRDHISQCDHCAQLIIDLGALNDSVSQIPLATLHRLSGIQEAELVEDEIRHSTRSAHPVMFVASIACLLLVMLTSGIWFSGNSNQVAVVDRLAQDEAVSVSVDENSIAANEPVEIEAPQQEVPLPFTMQQLGFVTPHKTSPPTEFIGAVNFGEFSGNVEPYQDYIDMTADLPGMRPVSNSVNATIQLIKTFSGQPQRNWYSGL